MVFSIDVKNTMLLVFDFLQNKVDGFIIFITLNVLSFNCGLT
jgi:hypothetical protein